MLNLTCPLALFYRPAVWGANPSVVNNASGKQLPYREQRLIMRIASSCTLLHHAHRYIVHTATSGTLLLRYSVSQVLCFSGTLFLRYSVSQVLCLLRYSVFSGTLSSQVLCPLMRDHFALACSTIRRSASAPPARWSARL